MMLRRIIFFLFIVTFSSTVFGSCVGILAPPVENAASDLLNQTVIVVDAFSSAHRYGYELKSRGFKNVIHIKSSDHIPKEIEAAINKTILLDDGTRLKRAHEYFDFHYEHENHGDTLEFLKTFKIAALFTGTETGVLLADTLSEAIRVRTNGTGLSIARRNKYWMVESIRNKIETQSSQITGRPFRLVKQALVLSYEDALLWQKNYGQWPVVIKPIDSAGGEGFHMCRTESDIRKAFDDLLGKTNELGLVNRELLIQESLVGDEYVFDVVGRDGEYVVSDFWKYHKRDLTRRGAHVRVYDYDELLPYEGAVQDEIMEYGFPIIRALGILNGPVHMEIMMTKNGPVMVEVAARLAGTDIPGVVRRCAGRGQVELNVDAYLFPEKFKTYVGRPYKLNYYGRNIDLISNGGHLRDGFMEKVRALSSYWKDSFHIEEGEELPVTVNLFTSPGTIFLVHENKAVLEEDYKFLTGQLQREYFLDDGQEINRAEE